MHRIIEWLSITADSVPTEFRPGRIVPLAAVHVRLSKERCIYCGALINDCKCLGRQTEVTETLHWHEWSVT